MKIERKKSLMPDNCENCEYTECFFNKKHNKKIKVELVKDDEWVDEFTECSIANEYCEGACPHVTCPKYVGLEEE